MVSAMGRPGQFARTLEPGLAVTDCCGRLVVNETPRPFRHPVYCLGECSVSREALRKNQDNDCRACDEPERYDDHTCVPTNWPPTTLDGED